MLKQKSIDGYVAELTAAWEARRCACGKPASVVTVGTAAVRQGGILLRREVREVNQCLGCAAVGWAEMPVEKRGRKR